MNSAPSGKRHLRPLLLLLLANIAFTVAGWYLAFTSVKWAAGLMAPLFSWPTTTVTGVICTQFVLFAFWMTLAEFRRPLRWTVTLAVLTVFALVLAIAHYTTGGVPGTPLFDYRGWEEAALYFAYVLTCGVVFVLLVQIVLWPAKASLGWTIRCGEDNRPETRPRFSLSQLFLWVGMIAALLSVSRTLLELEPSWIVFTVLWFVLTALVAIPTIFVAACSRRLLIVHSILGAYLLGLSYLESEFTALCFSFGINANWWPMWFILIVNSGVAATALINVWLLRGCGAVIHLPLWPGGSSIEDRSSVTRSRASP